VQRFSKKIRSRIITAGKKKAESMLKSYSSQGGVFAWAPQLKEWLRDANYVFYLGVNIQQ
jgi:hypothetical protein